MSQQQVYNNPQNPTVEGIYLVNLIIWAAMLLSQFLFLLIIYFTRAELFNLEALRNAPLVIEAVPFVLLIAGLTTFAVSFVLKFRFERLAIKNRAVILVQTGQIVAFALSEATSLFGFVAAFSFQTRWFFLWFALGILGILLHFPRRAAFQAAAFKGINLND